MRLIYESVSFISKEYPDTAGKLKDHQEEAQKNPEVEVYSTKEV